MPLLSVKNLSLRNGSRWLLRDVNLELDSGGALSVFGPAGSGKSLLAGVLAGLIQPYKGDIVVASSDGKVEISAAMQDFGLADELTVYENLMFFAQMAGLPGRLRSKKVSFLVEMLRLGNVRNDRASEISGNTAVRIEIARALIKDSAVYCIDGLLDTLSPETLEHLWDYLLELRRDNGAGLVVMTGSGRIAQMCSQTAVLVNGNIGFFGETEEFRRMAGEDMVVIGNIGSPLVRNRIKEQFAVMVSEEEGFLSFRVANSDKVVADILNEYGSDVGCVYLKRPTLDDALEVSMGSALHVNTEKLEKIIQ